ncbi:MAG: hypothetical protein IPK82_39720 [Polyangiaceae bacterium]|nr:hypothetical protein [Polyangiaceae bacterium]
MLTVSRFELADGQVWEPVPAAAQDAKTLAELCKKLKATNSTKYPDAYYNIDKMSTAERNRVALLLFDYWENTEYRFATITSGTFSWEGFHANSKTDLLSMLSTSAVSTWKTETPGVVKRIRYIPVLAPVPVVVAAKPGASVQKVVPPDPVLTLLDADISTIRWTADRIAYLLKQSAAAMEHLLALMRKVTAFRVLVETCTNTTRISDESAARLARARKLEKGVSDAIHAFRLPELMADTSLPAEVRVVLKRELGASDDVAHEIKRLAKDLADRLLSDSGAAGRAGKFARGVIEKKLTLLGTYEDKKKRLAAVLVDAIAVLQETGIDDVFQVALDEALRNVSEAPVLTIGDIRDATFLEAVFSLYGRQNMAAGISQLTSIGANLVGNLAGPPSLYIAVVQAECWFKLIWGLQKGSGLDDAAATKLLNDTIKRMTPGIPPTKSMVEKLTRAIHTRDVNLMRESQEQFLDETSAGRQGTPMWKGALLLVQLVGLIAAIRAANEDAKAGKPFDVMLMDVLGLAGQVPTFIAGVGDVAVTTKLGQAAVQWIRIRLDLGRLASFESTISAVSRFGLKVGILSSFLGTICSAYQLGIATRDKDALGIASAAFGVSGSAIMLVGNLYALVGVPVPHIQAIGLGLATVGMAIATVKLAVEAETPGPNVVAHKLLVLMERSPYSLVIFRNGSDLKALLDTLLDECTYEMRRPTTAILPASNNDFVARTLADAGFLREHIAMIVEKQGSQGLVSYTEGAEL